MSWEVFERSLLVKSNSLHTTRDCLHNLSCKRCTSVVSLLLYQLSGNKFVFWKYFFASFTSYNVKNQIFSKCILSNPTNTSLHFQTSWFSALHPDFIQSEHCNFVTCNLCICTPVAKWIGGRMGVQFTISAKCVALSQF